MSRHEVECFFSNEGTRNEVRMRVVDRLALEEAGTGKDENASRYIYYVETLADGNRVYLQRPANLHNGFDFLVCVENINYAVAGKRRRNYPKHQDFGEDLEAKKLKNPEMYKKLYKLLEKVYLCHDITDEDIQTLHFTSGYSPEHILKAIKWLFIEQDIRYWNYSGRSMTWGLVPQP